MIVHVCGTRGSTPAPGGAFVDYGGDTSCVALAHDDGPPVLVLDAGTGLTHLTALLDGAPFRGTMLLGHLHWDHLMGLPFFAAGDRPDARVALYVPGTDEPLAVMRQVMSPPYFPIEVSELRGAWSFHPLVPGVEEHDGFRVEALPIPHKGGVTYGFRISDDSATIAYLSDHVLGPGGRATPDARALCEGVDLLVHDAQFLPEEAAVAEAYGHSVIDDVLAFAADCSVRELLLFHHSPTRTDRQLDAIARGIEAGPMSVSLARSPSRRVVTR